MRSGLFGRFGEEFFRQLFGRFPGGIIVGHGLNKLRSGAVGVGIFGQFQFQLRFFDFKIFQRQKQANLIYQAVFFFVYHYGAGLQSLV